MTRSRPSFWSAPPPTLEEEKVRFAELQRELVDRWLRVRDIDSGPRDIVVVPSLSFDGMEFSSIPGFHFYEQRMLFTLSLLRHPRARLVYVTSQPVHPTALDYCFSLVTGTPRAHMRDRLTMLSCYDSTARPLTDKILERPRLIERIRSHIDPSRAHMVCFTVGPRERSLAVRLGIPLYGVDPELGHLGSKSGSRKVFRAAGIALPPGMEDLHTQDDVAEAIAELWDRDPTLQRVVVKQNEGFSGEGNAVLDLRPIASAAPHTSSKKACIEQVRAHMPTLNCIASHESSSRFFEGMQRLGGVVEAWIEGRTKRSPSAQLRINPRGEIEAMSTHDQILGADGQTYLGCRFPADEAYRLDIQNDALAVGVALRDAGVVGRVAVDFVAVERSPGQWERAAIEINLRMSGTTHPLMTMQMLNGGRYDAATGTYRSARGELRCYVATDSLTSPKWRGLLVEDAIDIASIHELHYKPWTDTGVVLHLMDALSQHGKMGVIAIGSSLQEADAFLEKTKAAFDLETSGER